MKSNWKRMDMPRCELADGAVYERVVLVGLQEV